MLKISRSLTALSLGIACALPAFAQTSSASTPSAAATTAAARANPGMTDPTAEAYGVPQSTPTPTTAAGSGVATAPATPSTGTESMANAMPSAPAISADAAGTSTPPSVPATQAMGAAPDTMERDDDGRDLGWLGLLGLLGLLGMRRKHQDVPHRPAATAHTR